MKNVLKGLFYHDTETHIWPPIDIYETGDDLVFEVDLPGIDLADLSIGVYEDLLIIEGAVTDTGNELPSGGLRYLCMERGTREFRRVLKIPVYVNTVAGGAFYQNGVITIRFPKLKGKLIKINIERR